MRLPIVAGNWKMNTTVDEAVALVRDMLGGLEDIGGVEKVVCPPFVSLAEVKPVLEKSSVKLGAQNLHFEEKGAFTGEVSPVMLAHLCEYVIVGHSERRQYFGETDETVNRRMQAVLAQGLKSILCVGEHLREREEGETFSVIERQMKAGLRILKEGDVEHVVIAYEPVWAIGTGKTATPDQAEEVHRFIRQNLEKRFSREISEKVRIQYGGSVTPENIKGLMEQEDIDGALVGGASLQSETFSRIVRFREM